MWVKAKPCAHTILTELNKMDLTLQIYNKTLALLQGWTGFSLCRELLADYPDLNLFLIGGVLRDIISQKNYSAKDFDLCFFGVDEELVLNRLAQCGQITKGQFGSPRWHPHQSAIYADIMHAHCFYNGLWRCEDVLDVINQVDITANAIALSLREPILLDPQNGVRDLQQGVLRAVRFDYPDEPITDHCSLTRLCVLWFRFVHYAAALDLQMEPVTGRWVLANQHYLNFKDSFCQYFFPLHPKALSVLQQLRP
jgi:tRNA nucleotidyltransferase (CCA-adding enzyme)